MSSFGELYGEWQMAGYDPETDEVDPVPVDREDEES